MSARSEFRTALRRALRAVIEAAEVSERFSGQHLAEPTPDGPQPRPRTVRREVNQACRRAQIWIDRATYAAAYVQHEQGDASFMAVGDALAEIQTTFTAMENSVGRFRVERSLWHAETTMHGLKAIRLLAEVARATRPRRVYQTTAPLALAEARDAA